MPERSFTGRWWWSKVAGLALSLAIFILYFERVY